MASNIATVKERCLSPGPQPNGIQAAADGLWVIDQVDLKVYKLDYETGETLFAAQTDTEHSSGITLGGGYLWIASTYELKIAQLELQTGRTIAKYDSPGAGITAPREGAENVRPTGSHGLEWKEGRLYVATPPSQMVHIMNPDPWKEEHRFRTTGFRNHGIAWGPKGRLWVADTSAGTLSLLDTRDGRVHDVIRVAAPDEVHGLSARDGVLWYCDAHTRAIGTLALES